MKMPAQGRRYGAIPRDRFLLSWREPVAEELPEMGEEDVWPPTGGDRGSGDGDMSPRWPETGDLRQHRPMGGLSLAFEEASPRIIRHHLREAESAAEGRTGQLVASAPVEVPNWGKILRAESAEEVEEEDEAERVPPHEYVARESARGRRAAATSVFEGVGRTLKGRDMSRVRDAVWSRTGFFG